MDVFMVDEFVYGCIQGAYKAYIGGYKVDMVV